jgi:hypothetical protein
MQLARARDSAVRLRYLVAGGPTLLVVVLEKRFELLDLLRIFGESIHERTVENRKPRD